MCVLRGAFLILFLFHGSIDSRGISGELLAKIKRKRMMLRTI